jgi:hypothetical protein
MDRCHLGRHLDRHHRCGWGLARWRSLAWLAAWLLIGIALLPGEAFAQAPKIGAYYKDNSDLGFMVKVPAEWQFIPPQPGDLNLIGKYAAPNEKGVQILSENKYWPFNAWLIKFDRRKANQQADDGKAKEDRRPQPPAAKDLAAWIDDQTNIARAQWKKASEAKLQIAGVEATEFQYDGKLGDTPVRLYAAVYRLSADAEVALLFNGPGDPKKWSKYESAFTTMAKSFKRSDVAAKDPSSNLGGGSLRARKKAQLADEVSRQPGWTLYETPNYFVLSNNPDKEFLDELLMRLEAIRKVYEETYPPSKAEELRKLAAAREAKDKAEGKTKPPKEGEEPTPPEEEGATKADAADPLEMSRTSVVRVVKDEEQYYSYGGPHGSAGYWSPGQQELVIYDDKAQGGRRNTWATLNHEAFHQYIFYFFGALSPHSWYNEGTGDFYSGYQLKNGKFELKAFDWRERLIQQLMRGSGTDRSGNAADCVPLKKFVRMTQAEYYEGKSVGNNYAQGWSFAFFLRTGAKKARCWNPAWNSILDTYLRVLVETDDLDAAVDQAFAGVDWDELEACWKQYILAG